MSPSRIALLRGVNVGGKNKLPMKDLAEIFRAQGCTDVETYIQSGNVVFHASASTAKGLEGRIAKAIARGFGFETTLVMRTADELGSMIANNPFAKRRVGPQALDSKALAVAFLADRPSPARVAALDPRRSPGDEFVVSGRDVYLWLPNGFAKTKITNAWLDAQLETTSTARNWRTVLELEARCSR